jgi:CheY-like chemotaxis protein
MPRILIVDDEIENLKSLKRFLGDHEPNWDIATAQSEGEAKASLSERPPDVVISDLVMSTEQGGMEVLSSRRKRTL